MTKTQAWIRSFRLRTLPLSSAGAILGAGLAFRDGNFSWFIAILCLVTVLLLQILANMANDLGDAEKGTDNEYRAGPLRSVQSGIISPKEMRIGIVICIIMILASGLSLLFYSFNTINYAFIGILLLGLAGIGAAIKYTVGRKAYGYYGLGDLFVFFFFGWIPVCIAYIVQTVDWNWEILLPGLTVGLLSVAVLNLNNLRDFKNDKLCNKKTLVVNIGVYNSKIYHTILLGMALLSAVFYTILTYQCTYQLLYLLVFIPLTIHLIRVWKTKQIKDLDPELKKVALSTVFLVVLWITGFALC
ncbi:1,4-dihydroxy-2-naphthoate prenyltransferase [Balneicella halophila]|uniref:1,4-dihydroxy-2-naphthoate octaprenyltransferase n=1 Tax=Balneicella halophila TaxID=1537566 RepID=A0A7L4UQS7_BALHA|nr:1,4-dihydroxy-2-naphthoate octaprenyltransferase [Balneicella halophila]PVX51791.1 1,4-dihydroxy-2-naphthoate prenyltransferase [Balneicella halophila]